MSGSVLLVASSRDGQEGVKEVVVLPQKNQNMEETVEMLLYVCDETV